MVDASRAFVLRRTNQLLLRREPPFEFVTAVLLVLDRNTGRAVYASAGHPAPVLLGRDSCRMLEAAAGIPLGSFDRDYTDVHLEIAAGDCLVLYTDGVIEARRGEELFGEQRLVEAVSELRGLSARRVAQRVRDAAASFAGELADDLEVLVLRLSAD